MRTITEEEIVAGLEALKVRTPAILFTTNAPTEAPMEPQQRDWLRVASEGQGSLSMRQIMLVVSAITGISPNDLRSPRRNARVVRARFMHFWSCRKFTSYSLPQIGHYTGRKDHSSVLHGVRKVAERRDEFEPELTQIEKALKRLEEAP